MLRTLIVLACVVAPLRAEESVAELKKKVERLEALVGKLEAQLEGTAAPINLARTNLASVSVSSVNGGRAQTNRYYGVLNLFDGGENWHNGINYTTWLSNGEPQPRVEIRFAEPVTVRSVEVEGGRAFRTELFMKKGGQVDRLDPGRPQPGVVRVRLTFPGPNVSVHEVRVMGYAAPGTAIEVRKPRIAMTRAHALAIARERFDEWRHGLVGSPVPEVREEDGAWHVLYPSRLRVRVRADGSAEIEPLAKLSPAE